MDINRKITIVSIIIIILLLVLFGTLRIINKKSQPNDLVTEKEVSVYFTTEEAMYLTEEKRIVNTDELYKNTLKELIEGPANPAYGKTIPEGVKILHIDVKDGLARVDFNRALVENHWGGSTGERMTVYSIVNTLTQFEEIEEVQFLIEGEKVESLAGHIDLNSPLSKNNNILKK